MGKLRDKQIGNMTVSLWDGGWPRWTHIDLADGRTGVGLDEEEVRELHFYLGRIIAQLDLKP